MSKASTRLRERRSGADRRRGADRRDGIRWEPDKEDRRDPGDRRAENQIWDETRRR